MYSLEPPPALLNALYGFELPTSTMANGGGGGGKGSAARRTVGSKQGGKGPAGAPSGLVFSSGAIMCGLPVGGESTNHTPVLVLQPHPLTLGAAAGKPCPCGCGCWPLVTAPPDVRQQPDQGQRQGQGGDQHEANGELEQQQQLEVRVVGEGEEAMRGTGEGQGAEGKGEEAGEEGACTCQGACSCSACAAAARCHATCGPADAEDGTAVMMGGAAGCCGSMPAGGRAGAAAWAGAAVGTGTRTGCCGSGVRGPGAEGSGDRTKADVEEGRDGHAGGAAGEQGKAGDVPGGCPAGDGGNGTAEGSVMVVRVGGCCGRGRGVEGGVITVALAAAREGTHAAPAEEQC